MPLFMCATCGCYDNTALGGYWAQQMKHSEKHGSREGFKPQCSEHNPDIGAWHGEFPKQRAEGWKIDGRGFIWRPAEVASVQHLGPFADVVLPT